MASKLFDPYTPDALYIRPAQGLFSIEPICEYITKLGYSHRVLERAEATFAVAEDPAALEYAKEKIRRTAGANIPPVLVVVVTPELVTVGLMVNDDKLVLGKQFVDWMCATFSCSVTDDYERDWTPPPRTA